MKLYKAIKQNLSWAVFFLKYKLGLAREGVDFD